jgi:3-oxoacyl-[acyl-carrier-protein] synthase II
MSLTEGVIPPTINLDNVDESIDPRLNLTPNVEQKRDVRYAMSNTFGFGGHNSSVIFKKM